MFPNFVLPGVRASVGSEVGKNILPPSLPLGASRLQALRVIQILFGLFHSILFPTPFTTGSKPDLET